MNVETRVQRLINELAQEVLSYLKTQEPYHQDRWVPAIHIKNSLQLNYVAVPKDNVQYGAKGWLFAILARILEDKNEVEYKKVDGRAYYRSK
jgi:Mn-containing catalase